MLTTLEQGVKGGKWFSLVDKVYSPAVLKTAFARVEANGGAPGVDRQTIEMFKRRLDDNLAYLSEQLQKDIPPPGDPADLYTQARQLREATPGDTHSTGSGGPDGYADGNRADLQRDFAEQSYGFRPGRGQRRSAKSGRPS